MISARARTTQSTDPADSDRDSHVTAPAPHVHTTEPHDIDQTRIYHIGYRTGIAIFGANCYRTAQNFSGRYRSWQWTVTGVTILVHIG